MVKLCGYLGYEPCVPNNDIKNEAIQIFETAKQISKKETTNEDFDKSIDMIIRKSLEKQTNLEEKDNYKSNETAGGSKLYKYNDVLVNIMNDIYSSNKNILSNNAIKLIKKIVKKIKKKDIDDKYVKKVNKIITKISSVESVIKLEKYLKLLYKV